MYKLLFDNLKKETRSDYILKKVEGDDADYFIPTDPDNTDYQQYLKWVEEGNTPLPADEGAA